MKTDQQIDSKTRLYISLRNRAQQISTEITVINAHPLFASALPLRVWPLMALIAQRQRLLTEQTHIYVQMVGIKPTINPQAHTYLIASVPTNGALQAIS